MKFHLLFFLAVAAGVALDLWSKSASFSRIAPGTFIEVVPGVLHLTPAANTGVAFSLLSGKILLISAVALLAIGVLLWMYARTWRNGPPLLLTAIGMILSGAIGNLHDRIVFGHVRDFIDFVPALPLVGHWPVFNVADICVTVGVGLYLLWEFALRPREAAGAETKHA